MNDLDQSEIESAITAAIRNMPFLSDFNAPLLRSAEPGSADPDATFAQLGELHGASPEPLTVRFHLSFGEQVRSWVLHADASGCRVMHDASGAADVEAFLDAQTWAMIASGEISPLEAFARGRMQVRGDIDIAGRFVRQLHRTGDAHS
jgi:hypothetical protein